MLLEFLFLFTNKSYFRFDDESDTLESWWLWNVCRASRGIDFSGVDHVVLFDFPRDPSEYVRRVGRTARGVGGKGKAFIFVVGKQVFLARKIMERNRKGHPLHDVPSFWAFRVIKTALLEYTTVKKSWTTWKLLLSLPSPTPTSAIYLYIYMYIFETRSALFYF